MFMYFNVFPCLLICIPLLVMILIWIFLITCFVFAFLFISSSTLTCLFADLHVLGTPAGYFWLSLFSCKYPLSSPIFLSLSNSHSLLFPLFYHSRIPFCSFRIFCFVFFLPLFPLPLSPFHTFSLFLFYFSFFCLLVSLVIIYMSISLIHSLPPIYSSLCVSSFSPLPLHLLFSHFLDV